MSEWLCTRENTVHPAQPGRTVFQPCPSCGDAMLPTSPERRELARLRADLETAQQERDAGYLVHSNTKQLLEVVVRERTEVLAPKEVPAPP